MAQPRYGFDPKLERRNSRFYPERGGGVSREIPRQSYEQLMASLTGGSPVSGGALGGQKRWGGGGGQMRTAGYSGPGITPPSAPSTTHNTRRYHQDPSHSGGGYYTWEQTKSGGQGTVPKRHPEGTSRYYDDSYLQLLNALQSGDNPEGGWQNLLTEFKGSPGDLQRFMEHPAFRATQSYLMGNTPAAQMLGDFSMEPSMQALAAGQGAIGRGQAQATEQGQRALNQAGMGRNAGLMSAVARSAAQNAGQQSADLRARLEQQRYQNLMNQAQRRMDIDRLMTQLALGYNVQPRQGGGDDNGELGALIGTVLGAGIGSFAGPAGTAAGAQVGAGIGGYADREI